MTKEKGRGKVPVALAINSLAFALGSLGGFCLVRWLSGRGLLDLPGWLESFALGLTTEGAGDVSFLAVLWDAVRWPLFVLLLGCTALGVWMIPVMFALRGFCLCFTVSALAGAGQGGFPLALVLLGLGGVVKLPAFFLLGVRGWGEAAAQRGRLLAPPGDWGGRHLAQTGLILGCVAGCAWLEFWCVPVLLRWIAPLLGSGG